jgi:uncharacterized protein YgfB (UPF0149 family)
MNEDEAILYLLDLGTGAAYRKSRNSEALEIVDEIQHMCGIDERDEKEIKKRLSESDTVNYSMLSLSL